jgi:hypothetical protein
MVSQINTNTARDKNANKLSYAHGFIARDHASRNAGYNENMPIDDVIAHLANAHENRRARQVTKWEQIGGFSLWRWV